MRCKALLLTLTDRVRRHSMRCNAQANVLRPLLLALIRAQSSRANDCPAKSLHEKIVSFFAGISLLARYRISYAHDGYNEGPTMMKSSIVKRSIVIDGHKTSVSLEDAFWTVLKDIAHAECATVSKIVADIDKKRKLGNLSSAIRLFVLDRKSVV